MVCWHHGKVILRWRRKRTGLRGFKFKFLTAKSESEGQYSDEDDYDFFKERRKQVEGNATKSIIQSEIDGPKSRSKRSIPQAAYHGARDQEDEGTANLIPLKKCNMLPFLF